MAELVGAAIARTSHLQSLADANRIIENSPTILYRAGPRPPFPLIFLSENVKRYGYLADELLAHPDRWPLLIDASDRPAVIDNTRAIGEGQLDSHHAEFRLHKPDGSIVWFESHGTALHDGDGRLTAIEGILTDVTERKQAESELSFSHLLLTTAIESSPDAILIVDANGRIIVFNRHFVELWNISVETLRAGNDAPVLATVSARMKNEGEFLARVRYIYDHPEMQSHEEIELKDGRIIERHSGSLHDVQRKYLGRVWFFRDITEKRHAEEEIATLARTDALTSLANRATFLDRLNLEFARARRGGSQFAVLYLDLDHFKDVNDTLGHPIGDRLLQTLANRLKASLREIDMLARFGGDEFAILQDGIENSGSAEVLATKIGEVMATPYALDGNEVHTTVSIGIVPYRSDIAGADAMMMKADLALYRAKNEGRNQFRFHIAELDEQTRERMIIGEELRHTIERGELELFYQPQVEVASGRIVGLEALIRWHHPKRGLLLPTSFIPIAETTGSILPIGEWVIEQVCRQIQSWANAGIAPPTVAANISAVQFKFASGLDRMVAKNLARFDVAPNHLELELTESVLMETRQKYSEEFDRLRQIGVRLAIDDFGTGYSSLDYLRSFRVARLKIDRRFVSEVLTNPDCATIVRATIGLAHELGIEVIAEGVETIGQRDFLIASGCSFGQGYYFGKPVPAVAASRLLRRNKRFTVA